MDFIITKKNISNHNIKIRTDFLLITLVQNTLFILCLIFLIFQVCPLNRNKKAAKKKTAPIPQTLSKIMTRGMITVSRVEITNIICPVIICDRV